MATVAPRSAQPYGHYRHHPYASPAASSSSSSHRGPKWQTSPSEPQPRDAREVREQRGEPPSPPHSRREQSEAPSIGLGVAFGGAPGGKWWDEELPAPPSSLSSILESFRKSGEGDRELLLSILGAKKAEEERLTALIQTRLTILQARLSIHSAAASLNSSPMPPMDVHLPALMPERTPSLNSSRGSASSSSGPLSPTFMGPPNVPQLSSEKGAKATYFNLPPPQSMLRRRSRSRSPERYYESRLHPSMAGDARDARSRGSSPRSASDGRAPGLDMLLDAGMERERRDSNERK